MRSDRNGPDSESELAPPVFGSSVIGVAGTVPVGVTGGVAGTVSVGANVGVAAGSVGVGVGVLALSVGLGVAVDVWASI